MSVRAPLFGPRANRVLRGVLIGLVLAGAAVPAALMGWARTSWARGAVDDHEQPVPFDHRHHVLDDGIDCRYCHWAVDRAPSAGLPSSDLCMGCHAQVLIESPVLEPVRASVAEGRPIEWMRVHRLPDFVFFDHGIHVAGGVGCETCHGRVDLMPRVRQVRTLEMGWCLDCHRGEGPPPRPATEITTMGYATPSDDDGAPDAVRGPTTCTACHR